METALISYTGYIFPSVCLINLGIFQSSRIRSYGKIDVYHEFNEMIVTPLCELLLCGRETLKMV